MLNHNFSCNNILMRIWILSILKTLKDTFLSTGNIKTFKKNYIPNIYL